MLTKSSSEEESQRGRRKKGEEEREGEREATKMGWRRLAGQESKKLLSLISPQLGGKQKKEKKLVLFLPSFRRRPSHVRRGETQLRETNMQYGVKFQQARQARAGAKREEEGKVAPVVCPPFSSLLFSSSLRGIRGTKEREKKEEGNFSY